MLASQGILTYCANRRSTVPMYADAFGLLVLTASLTSAFLIAVFRPKRPDPSTGGRGRIYPGCPW